MLPLDPTLDFYYQAVKPKTDVKVTFKRFLSLVKINFSTFFLFLFFIPLPAETLRAENSQQHGRARHLYAEAYRNLNQRSYQQALVGYRTFFEHIPDGRTEIENGMASSENENEPEEILKYYQEDPFHCQSTSFEDYQNRPGLSSNSSITLVQQIKAAYQGLLLARYLAEDERFFIQKLNELKAFSEQPAYAEELPSGLKKILEDEESTAGPIECLFIIEETLQNYRAARSSREHPLQSRLIEETYLQYRNIFFLTGNHRSRYSLATFLVREGRSLEARAALRSILDQIKLETEEDWITVIEVFRQMQLIYRRAGQQNHEHTLQQITSILEQNLHQEDSPLLQTALRESAGENLANHEALWLLDQIERNRGNITNRYRRIREDIEDAEDITNPARIYREWYRFENQNR